MVLKLNELRPTPGARSERKRVGRGTGSGVGKTSGRGHKGQKARAGGGVRPGFEGGQMPLQRRTPKRGFKNRFRTEYAVVNIEALNGFAAGTTVTPEMLIEARLVRKLGAGVKILAGGEIDRALTVQAHQFSQAAREKIEAAGGKAEVVGGAEASRE